MTEAQARRVDSIKRRTSVKGAIEDNDGNVIVGWERTRDGRDMTTTLDRDGRTVSTEPTYRHR